MSLFSGLRSGLRSGIRSGINPSDANVIGRIPIGYFGQSNNQGFNSPLTPSGVSMARAITIATGYSAAFPAVFEFRKFGATPPDPPTWLTTGGVAQGPVALGPRAADAENQAGNFGLSLGLGRYLDHSLPGGFVTAGFALGGTMLATNWKAPGGSYPSNPQARLADQLITFMQAVQTATGETMGAFIMSLGTSDAGVTANAAAYQTNLTNFYNYVSPSFPGVVWIIEQISSLSAGGADLTAVRTAQSAFVTAQNLLVPNSTILVNAESLPIPGVEANLTHYPANAYVIMGRRYAVQVLAALAIPEIPQANFRWFGTGTSVVFTDLSVNANSAVNTWAWDFGDGATSTSQNPTRVYAAPGTYTVRLTATSANGKSEAIAQSVIVATNAWTIDATAGIACPATLAEENAFLAAAMPTSATSGPCSHLWLQQANCQLTPFQDPDVLGSAPLGANGVFVSQSPEALWTRLGNRWVDNVSNRQMSSTSANLPDPSTTSTLLIGYWTMPAAAPAAGAARGCMSIGVTGNGDIRISLTTGKLRQAAVVNTEIVNSACTGTRNFIAIQDDVTAGEVRIYTEQEAFVFPRRTPASSKSVGIGGFTANSPDAACVYLKLYRDDAARKTQAELRAYFRAAGWNPTNW